MTDQPIEDRLTSHEACALMYPEFAALWGVYYDETRRVVRQELDLGD